MKLLDLTKATGLATSVALLSACGGGTTGPDGPAYETLNATTQTDLDVMAVTLDGGSHTAGTATGTYDGSANMLNIGATSIALDTTTFSGSYDYVSLLDSTGDNAIVVIQTDVADLPTGSVSFTGEATVNVVVASGPSAGTYAGKMDASIIADFANSASGVDVTFNNITDASVLAGLSPSTVYIANGTEVIAFNDLSLSGAGFASVAGSSATIDGFGSAVSTIDTTGSSLSVAGVFAGDQADEVAGTAALNGATGSALVTFVGD